MSTEGKLEVKNKAASGWITKTNAKGEQLISSYTNKPLTKVRIVLNEAFPAGTILEGFYDSGKEKAKETLPDMRFRVAVPKTSSTATQGGSTPGSSDTVPF